MNINRPLTDAIGAVTEVKDRFDAFRTTHVIFTADANYYQSLVDYMKALSDLLDRSIKCMKLIDENHATIKKFLLTCIDQEKIKNISDEQFSHLGNYTTISHGILSITDSLITLCYFMQSDMITLYKSLGFSDSALMTNPGAGSDPNPAFIANCINDYLSVFNFNATEVHDYVVLAMIANIKGDQDEE